VYPDGLQVPLDALPLGIYVVNREGRILVWSEGAEKLTGYLRQDVLGRPCRADILVHCDAENNPRKWPLLTRRESRPVAERPSRDVVKLQTVPLRDDRGSLIGAAELFEPVLAPKSHDRRLNELAAYGCLDAQTGLLPEREPSGTRRERSKGLMSTEAARNTRESIS